ncbi:MAG TPA: hypothetical protein VGX24_10275 [Pyrinomonadaceae bacterium]|jgi:hypothetical protein|nr:hypothetical protein [Pyrinomonadaceae bacterium]
MNKLSSLGAAIIIACVACVAHGQTPAADTTTTSRGTDNASIFARTTTAQQPQPRATPSPVPTVRPLSQEDQQRQQAASERRRQSAATGDPDVLLDVPNLSVEEITLEVENLRARVSLDARLANLLQLTAGADAGIDKVKLTIKGVRAELLLKVRLDNVAAIIDRTLTTIDRNPQILERLLQSVDTTVGTVGGVANTALQPGGVVDRTVGTVGQTLNNVTRPGGLLSSTVNTLGQTLQRTVDRSGNILERTLDTAGTVVNQRTVGNVLNLSTVRETTGAGGQILRQVRDTSGAIIELTLDAAGKVTNSRVISQATGTNQQ